MGRARRDALGRRDHVRLLVLYGATQEVAPKPGQPLVQILPALGNLFQRSPTNVFMHGFLPVLPMCLGSALWMIVVSSHSAA